MFIGWSYLSGLLIKKIAILLVFGCGGCFSLCECCSIYVICLLCMVVWCCGVVCGNVEVILILDGLL